VAIAVATDDQWKRLCSVLGEPAWSDDPDFATAQGRRRAQDLIDEELARWTSATAAEEIAQLLSGHGVPAEVVISSRDIVANPQLRARGLFEVEHHEITGQHELPTLPFRYSRVSSWMHSPSPTLGEHNEEVLSEVGLTSDELASLRDSGILGERVAGAE
jgi:crotonobetainyl-CoA:carnitine CoA-transferase CaiB-like acyl-CoA transferase